MPHVSPVSTPAPSPRDTLSSTTRTSLPDACLDEARDLLLDLHGVLQPPLELVRDGARAHLRSDEGSEHEAAVHVLPPRVGVGEQAAAQVVAVLGEEQQQRGPVLVDDRQIDALS